MMCNVCSEHTVPIKWDYPRSSAVAPIIEVSKVKEAGKTTKSQKSLNKVITALLGEIENEVLIPILKAKTQKQLIREITNKFGKFFELRRSVIAAFLSNFQEKDFNRLLSFIKSKAEKDIDSFLEKKAGAIIGEDATLSVIFALDTNRKVNKSFLESFRQNIIDKQWLEGHNRDFYKLEFAKALLDLHMCSLFLSFKNELPFNVRENVLRTLAFSCKDIAVLIYSCAKELDTIKFPKLEVKEPFEMESDEEDVFLAEAGFKDYTALLKREENE